MDGPNGTVPDSMTVFLSKPMIVPVVMAVIVPVVMAHHLFHSFMGVVLPVVEVAVHLEHEKAHPGDNQRRVDHGSKTLESP